MAKSFRLCWNLWLSSIG